MAKYNSHANMTESRRRPFYTEKKKKVGNYILEDPLGEGAFGRVRYGLHVPTNETVAIKLVTKRVLVRSEPARRSLRREGNVLQRLDHPNIIKLYEAMETRTCYYLVFDLASGGSFLDFLTKKRCLLEDEARLFIREIVSAVDHIHTSGIVHRDLRLENLLLDCNRHIKITGFGLAVLQNEASSPRNRCGSPAYAAPEVFVNRTCGTGVDIWSIGVCLFAMLIGHLPFFPGQIKDIPELHALVLKGVKIPSYLSKDCFDLVSLMMKPLLSDRITMHYLLQHNWLVKGFQKNIPRQPPIYKLAPPSVDPRLAQYISYICGYNITEIEHVVNHRQINHISATYNLLVKSVRDGFRIPDITELEFSRHDYSEEFLHSTQAQIMQEYIESILTDTDSARSVALSPSQSIALYKSCVTCLKEARCLVHFPEQPIVQKRLDRDGLSQLKTDQTNKSFSIPDQSFQYLSDTDISKSSKRTDQRYQNSKIMKNVSTEIPKFVKQYLIDSDTSTIDELRQMSIKSDINLPELIIEYLCQQQVVNNGTELRFNEETQSGILVEEAPPISSSHMQNGILDVYPGAEGIDNQSNQSSNVCHETSRDVISLQDNSITGGPTNSKLKNKTPDEDNQTINTGAQSDPAVTGRVESYIPDQVYQTSYGSLQVPNLDLSTNIPDTPIIESTRIIYQNNSHYQSQAAQLQHSVVDEDGRWLSTDLIPEINGLRDPYAEEIWIAMYPKTKKLQTPIDVSPRRPVSFNSPISSPKLLTSRRSCPSNKSLAILRQMAACSVSNTNGPVILDERTSKILPEIVTDENRTSHSNHRESVSDSVIKITIKY